MKFALLWGLFLYAHTHTTYTSTTTTRKAKNKTIEYDHYMKEKETMSIQKTI